MRVNLKMNVTYLGWKGEWIVDDRSDRKEVIYESSRVKISFDRAFECWERENGRQKRT